MASPDVREDLARNLRIDFFEEDEIRSILSAIDRLPSDVQRTALALCHTLSQASSTFLPKAVKRIVKASRVFPHDRLIDWLDDVYRALDHEGVSAFVELSSLIDADDFAASFLSAGLPLDDVSPVLETYLQALSGREFPILAGPVSYTDLATVYLPETLGDFPETDRNLFLYRYLCCQAWAQSVCGSLELPPGLMPEEKGGEAADIDRYFSRFSDARLAADIFAFIESQRITPFLERELPGLMRRAHEFRDHYLRRMSDNGGQDRNGFMRALLRIALGDAGSSLGRLGHEMLGIRGEGIDASVRLLEDVYAFAENLGGSYLPLPLPPVILAIRPEETGRQIRHRRLLRLRKYEGLVSELLSIPEAPRMSLRLHAQRPGTRPVDPAKEYLVLKGRLIEFDRELQEMMKDREGILGGILVKGADAPGAAGALSLRDLAEEDEASAEPTDGGVRYDEWDCKRAGYKKAWCVVREKSLHGSEESFVAETLKKYRGQIISLRRKFEMLRRAPALLKRQYEGDDLDIDAVVESLADVRAGLSPRENLFIRNDRQERDMAALFLVDMSGSTKGWVIDAEKEALILMTEALEALGDRYAIYGFSGMTRFRCDIYTIKSFREGYTEAVKRRIGNIAPKDYTRMGAAIRHSSRVLKSVDARMRLLISISDGKPEDYDAYKGDYGIEDTRRALIEARELGIHPFCITIDREARTYLRHMYGDTGYVVIDDLRRLPGKITEIYRKLTT